MLTFIIITVVEKIIWLPGLETCLFHHQHIPLNRTLVETWRGMVECPS